MARQDLNVGIIGAGIGGLMAAITIASAGGKVTVLEAATQLGEIGAGIQMVRDPTTCSSTGHLHSRRLRMPRAC